MIRVLICDDQEVVTEGLRVILGTSPDIEVVGVAHDGAEAVEKVAALHPDVALMDLKMPGVNGIQATQQIHDRCPGVRVLVLTTYDADEWVFDAIRSGAHGYLLKDTPRQNLIAAVKDAMAGKTPVDAGVAGKLFEHIAQKSVAPADTSIREDLSERELEVLRLLARGLSNADIAGRLYLSEGTVRNYVSAILAKLNVADRTQAAVMALRYGLAEG
ncbi:MAG TPA: response regulator transcription factor [Anaerolineae bacterium]|nr:response regulator transcription factor [Anaerolineae bacterium]